MSVSSFEKVRASIKRATALGSTEDEAIAAVATALDVPVWSIREVIAHGRLTLPNEQWLRSPKMPEYAICFDPADPFFLWKMVENEAYGTWTSVAALTPEEMVELVAKVDPVLEPFKPIVRARLAELGAFAAADRARGAAVAAGYGQPGATA